MCWWEASEWLMGWGAQRLSGGGLSNPGVIRKGIVSKKWEKQINICILTVSVKLLERPYDLVYSLQLPEYQGTPCLKQLQCLKVK